MSPGPHWNPKLESAIEPVGSVTTLKLTPLLAVPSTLTTTSPDVAPEGTLATMAVSVQFETDAVWPLNVTVFEPWLEPKLEPETVTEAPITPEVGERLVIVGEPVGGGVTMAGREELPPQPASHSKSAIETKRAKFHDMWGKWADICSVAPKRRLRMDRTTLTRWLLQSFASEVHVCMFTAR